MKSDDISPLPKKRSNGFAITSLVLAIIPLVIILLAFLFLDIAINGYADGDIAQGFWPVLMLLIIVVYVVGLIANILAVIFGILAIIKQRRLFSWLGIIVVILEVLIFMVI